MLRPSRSSGSDPAVAIRDRLRLVPLESLETKRRGSGERTPSRDTAVDSTASDVPPSQGLHSKRRGSIDR
ncbi:hypothetical protein NJ7G_0349 [Natrinema sp. J7-2]|nr:hypothetical protein NJ7G_0349 [Natrinema sp. J7-2]